MAKDKDQRYFYLKGRIPHVRKALSKKTIEVFDQWKVVYRQIMDNDRFHLHEDEPALQYTPVERVDRALALIERIEEGFAAVRREMAVRAEFETEHSQLFDEYHNYRG